MVFNVTAQDAKVASVNNMPNAFTSDSQRIIFQSHVKSQAGKYTSQLLSMKLDGSDIKQEVVAGKKLGWPEFTADGKKAALFAEINGNYELLVVNVAKANNLSEFTSVQRITTHEKEDFFASWSPNEEQIAFYSHRKEPAQIYVIDQDGSNVKNLSNNSARESDPDWSSQNQITFQSDLAGNNDIWVMDDKGNNRKNLTNHPSQDHFGDWSPDGEYIVFSSDRDGDEDLYIMAKDGSELRQLTNGEGIDHWPLWSPDGKTITFARVVNGWGNVYTIHADGNLETKLTENRSYLMN
jgi:Tol biopolymer transport system component